MRISLTMLCCALLSSLTVATAVAPAGFAQSAGDEQYVDPFQTEPEPGGGGGNAGSGGGDTGSGTDSGSGGAEQQPSAPETPAAEPPADTSGVTAPAESDPTAGASGGSALPRTGLPLLAGFGAGVLLVGAGCLLRRHA